MTEVAIYTLNDPRTGEVRYVGKTWQTPRTRFLAHLRCKRDSHCSRWILSLKALGLLPVFDVIDYATYMEWEAVEKEYIRVFRMIGIRLTNVAGGGQSSPLGCLGSFRGRKHAPASIEKMRLASSGKDLSRAHRAAWSANKGNKYILGNQFRLGVPHTDEVKKRMSLSKLGNASGRGNLGKPKSEEHRKNIGEARLKWFAARKAASPVLSETSTT